MRAVEKKELIGFGTISDVLILVILFFPDTFVFGTGGRIRESPRRIDFSASDPERGF
jgi:hypothetical protein